MSATSPCLLRDDQKWRNNARQYSGSAQCAECYRTVIPGDTRMSSPGPPSTIARFTPFLKTCNPVGGGALFAYPLFISEHPTWGRQKGVTPICSDSLHSLPICFCVPCFGNNPICSDLFRFTPFFFPICSDLFSEQIRTNQRNPFLPTPFRNPRLIHLPRSPSPVGMPTPVKMPRGNAPSPWECPRGNAPSPWECPIPVGMPQMPPWECPIPVECPRGNAPSP